MGWLAQTQLTLTSEATDRRLRLELETKPIQIVRVKY